MVVQRYCSCEFGMLPDTVLETFWIIINTNREMKKVNFSLVKFVGRITMTLGPVKLLVVLSEGQKSPK